MDHHWCRSNVSFESDRFFVNFDSLAVSFRGRNAATSNTRHDFYVELSGRFYHYWLALSIYLPTYNHSVLPSLEPMRLARRPQPFDHPDWLYEIKFDGFRALAYIEAGKCRLVSRRRHEYKSFHELCASIAGHLRGNEAVLDGEIVCSINTAAHSSRS